MKTAMQELAMVVEAEQDIIQVSKLLTKEKQQLIDAFVEGWNKSKTALITNKATFYANKFYNETYNKYDNETKSNSTG